MKKILLTGASGFIGSHIAEYFKSREEDITCLVRRNSNKEFINFIQLKTIEGNLENVNELTKLLSGFDFLIHAAGRVSDWGKLTEFETNNVINTQNLINASIINGIKDIIITGTNSCYGEESSTKIKDETYEYNSHYNYFLDSIFPSAMNCYRDSKTKSVIEAKKIAMQNQINLTIIHPVFVYGEREFSSGFYEYLKALKDGAKLFPGTSKNKFHTIYARNLAKIYYLAYKKGLTGINEFLACDKFAEYQQVIYGKFRKYAGYQAPILLPKSIIYLPALVMELLYTLFGSKKASLLTRARVNMFYDNIEYSAEKTIRELNYIPDYDLDEGIEKTVNWYKSNNYI